MSSTVALSPCSSYAPEEVERALTEALDAVGGLDWVRPGMRIAVKVNLVALAKPEKAVTTHPEPVACLCRMLAQRGAEVVVGDSPGGPWLAPYVSRIYKAAGMSAVEEAGATLNRDFGQVDRHYPEALRLKDFICTSWLTEADAIINFCKLKTHGMMGMSCAVKNLFGCIPGTLKPEYHFRFPHTEQFAEMLLDLNTYLHPRLNIVDAVTAMEGNGPTAGTPRHVGALLASADPFALDAVCADLIGLSVAAVPTLSAARAHGLGPADVSEVTLIGDPAPLRVPDFERIERASDLEFGGRDGRRIGALVSRLLGLALRSQPRVEKKECIGCGACAKVCPAHAITMRERKPHVNTHVCIHCFCCQEFCPEGAMKVHRPLLARTIHPTARKTKQ